MMDFGIVEWVLVLLGAVCIGVSKTSVPGVSMVTVSLYASLFSPQDSVGVVYVILAIVNIQAAWIYRKDVYWGAVVKLMPVTLLGMFGGYLLVKWISLDFLGEMIGVVLLSMAVLYFYRVWVDRRRGLREEVVFKGGKVLLVCVGILTGVATVIANAAGQITTLYMLSLRLDKYTFVGTMAWFYLFVNAMKLPFQVAMFDMSWELLWLGLGLSVVGVLTGMFGRRLLSWVPESLLVKLVWGFVVLAALKLLLL